LEYQIKRRRSALLSADQGDVSAAAFCLNIQALSQPANPAIKKSQSCTVKKTIMKVEL
jgi:hypothetical protein